MHEQFFQQWLKTFQLIFHQCAFGKRKFQSHLLIVIFQMLLLKFLNNVWTLQQCGSNSIFDHLFFSTVAIEDHHWNMREFDTCKDR